MAGKKYTNDYRLTERVDDRGRVRRETEYVGPRYRAVLGPDDFRRQRRLALFVCAAGFAAFAAALVPRSAASHRAYIALPFVFSVLPLGIAGETLLSVPRDGGALERRQADRLANRYPAAALFVVLLCAAALIGEGAYALSGGALSAGDAVFSLFAALYGACGVFLFRKRRSFDTRKD